MLGFGTIGQFTIGEAGTGSAETISADKWFVPLSEPVRFKPGVSAARQQFDTLKDGFPFVSFSWFEDLSKPPIVAKPQLKAAQQQFLAFYPTPSPFVATGWFEPLAEPVRFKPGLPPSRQPFIARDDGFIPGPATLLQGWFTLLGEPVRFRQGLSARFQQDLGYYPRILPNPNVTGILNPTETDLDEYTIVVNVLKSNPPATAVVSITEIGTGFSATSVIESS